MKEKKRRIGISMAQSQNSLIIRILIVIYVYSVHFKRFISTEKLSFSSSILNQATNSKKKNRVTELIKSLKAHNSIATDYISYQLKKKSDWIILGCKYFASHADFRSQVIQKPGDLILKLKSKLTNIYFKETPSFFTS